MADGPAGLRLNKDYGKDENGVYAWRALCSRVRGVHGRGNRRRFGSMAKKEPERHGEILHQYCSALPIGTALAQSWNLELCRACGDLVGDEMERFGVHLWLAPALNIHRSPLCGRNLSTSPRTPW